MQITLTQFEQIDSLMQDVLRRGELNIAATTRAQVTDWMRKEWMLQDALVEAFGLDFVQSYPSALECAADVVAMALLCKIEVLDGEVA